jgi:hypothetical protein
MGFGQLYYTSCEHGLAGYAGFQFNAASPDIAPEVMRAVETLTAYEPPRSVGHQPTREEIAAAPRNLCFTPGAPMVVANVVFVGTDFSQRSGNYFAHALVSAPRAAELTGLLPIELWGAPFWETTPAQHTALPERAGPLPRGPLSRSGADKFVQHHQCGHRLATLVTAAAQAVLDGERSVVIVEPAADAAAHWIAAVSFLLPSQLARRMSFATYHHRPSHSQLNVMGTLPDADVDLTGHALDDYYLFDFVHDRVSDLAVHPLAQLLSTLGAVEAEQVWKRAESLAGGSEQTLDDWHPIVAAVRSATGDRLPAVDLVVATRWLVGSGSGADRDLALAVGRAALDDPAVVTEHLADVATLARLAGDTALLIQVEQAAVVEELRRLPLGGVSTKVRLTTAEGRAFGSHQLAEHLRRAEPPAAVSLLGLAVDFGVELPAEALRSCGEQTLGPHVLRRPDDTGAIDVLAGDQNLLVGALAYLAVQADREAAAVVGVLRGGVADIVAKTGVRVDGRLRDLMVIATCPPGPDSRFPTFKTIVSSGRRAVDDQTLRLIWPGGVWRPDEAGQVVRLLAGRAGAEQLRAEPCRSWLSRTLVQPFLCGDPGFLQVYVQLCRELHKYGLVKSLSDEAQELVNAVLDAESRIAECRSAKKADRGRLVVGLCRTYPAAPPPVQELLLHRLSVMIAEVTDAEQLRAILVACPDPVTDRYLDEAGSRLAGSSRDPKRAAALFWTLQSPNRVPGGLRHRLNSTLRSALRKWKRRELKEVSAELKRRSVLAACDFDEWCDNELPGRLVRVAGRLIPHRPIGKK